MSGPTPAEVVGVLDGIEAQWAGVLQDLIDEACSRNPHEWDAADEAGQL